MADSNRARFSPSNPIVKLCLQGLAMEDAGSPEAAGRLFSQAWSESAHAFEKFLSAHFSARHQTSTSDRLRWLETALRLALQIDDDSVKSALPALHTNIARCHEELGDTVQARAHHESAASLRYQISDRGPFFHGTRADLRVGDLLTPGGLSNYQRALRMNHIYFTAIVDGAGLAAALANGEGRERVYLVEPTGAFENDPNVTDKKFPGNPTRSYRSVSPLRIVGEAEAWSRLSPEEIQRWRAKLAGNQGEIIN